MAQENICATLVSPILGLLPESDYSARLWMPRALPLTISSMMTNQSPFSIQETKREEMLIHFK